MAYYITIDTGGTFTDVAVYNSETNEVSYNKNLTEYGDLVDSALHSVDKIKAAICEAAIVKHGTTHVINTIVQRTGGRTALVATRGFSDIVEIGRGNRPVPFDLAYRRNAPLVLRNLRYEVTERINYKGEIIEALNVDELHQVAELIRGNNIEAIAVSFINSYVNQTHEMEAVRILKELLPNCYVTPGSQLSREWFEYERTSTAVANAYVGAKMQKYIAQFDKKLNARDFAGQLYMMGSNGGVLSTQRAIEQPIAMIESGPVGGCVGASAYARALNIDKLIAFDMGGTTAKCALVRAGEFDVNPIYYVQGYDYGYPIKTPVLDIIEVGAGGGSIAAVDEFGRLSVGPQSAGSEPGPVAFCRGGMKPTVTDANVALGRIGEGRFLGGSFRIDESKARSIIEQDIVQKMGYSGERGVDSAAYGVLELANTKMCSAIKEITIERGHDVRDYKLFVFGGGGPLFATLLARSMGISSIIIPPNPGNFCTVGMLLSGARIDLSHTILIRDIENSPAEMDREFDRLEAEARRAMREELNTEEINFERSVEMRYVGQKYTIRVDYKVNSTGDLVYRKFVEKYSDQYGLEMPRSNPIEIIGINLRAEAKIPSPLLEDLSHINNECISEPVGKRSVYISPELGRVDVPVWDRKTLFRTQAINGPCIIEEFGATTYLGTNDIATVGKFGELHIECLAQ